MGVDGKQETEKLLRGSYSKFKVKDSIAVKMVCRAQLAPAI